jgi:hypothetical protein
MGGQERITSHLWAHLAIAQDEVRQDREHGATRGALHPPDGETTQPDTGIMGVARETPASATGRLMFQLQAKGEEKGEHTFDKRFAVAQQLPIGRFVLKINGDGPVFAGLTGSGSHELPSNPPGS